METASPMESDEPPPAAIDPPPSTSSDPATLPPTAPELEAEAAVESNPPAPSSHQQPQPSNSSSATPQAGTPKIPQSASPFPSLQQPADLSSQTPPQQQSQLQSRFQTQPQPQTAGLPVAPSPQAQPLTHSQLGQPQQRPPQPGRPLRSTQSSFSSLFPPHVSSSGPAAASPSSSLPSAAPSLPSSSGPLPRGGMAIGVPAALHHQRPPQQSPVSFSTFGPSAPFGQLFNGLPRGSVSVPNQAAGAAAQVRQPVHAIPSGGMAGAHTASSMRPGGVLGGNQQRPGQLTLRTTSSSNTQSSTGQKFQTHGLIRGPSAPSSSSTLPGPSQSSRPLQQPWLSVPGRPTNPPSLSTTSYRPQNKAQGLQQRPQQQQQSVPTTLQQSQMPSSQQQPKPLQHLQQQQHQQQQPQLTPEQQQQPPLQPQQQQQKQQVAGPIQLLAKVQQSAHHQQQSSRSANQKTPAPATLQQGPAQPGPTSPTAGMDVGEPGNRIISKRSIHELVAQIDPSEKLDPEVEDILMEIAEDFVESITTFGCSLAKHRKSTTLEAKDILLHLERNWNMTIPGFGGDEIKCYKKPFTNDIHKERLSLIKKSLSSTDVGNAKNSAGQSAPNSKSHAPKAPLIGSPTVT